MKSFFISLIFLFFSLNAFSLTNNEINKICKKQANEFLCRKRLKINRYRLKVGKPIEIPVLPYKK